MSSKNESPRKTGASLQTRTIGLIVNPVAGMGGAVGLKGTDGKTILKEAILLGAKPIAPTRAKFFLSELSTAQKAYRIVVGAGSMGEDETKNFDFDIAILGERKDETTAKDTHQIAERMADAGVNLLVFCGGDGTARDVLKAVGRALPVLGVPTGVKMHSAVFAVSPQAAARVVIAFLEDELPLREAEVMDVDEKAFREGHLSAELYGFVLTPYEPHLIQGTKMASHITESELRNQAAIAIYVIENLQQNVIYILGPGTTTRTIGDLLDMKKTLLGVDLFFNKSIIANDVNEQQILKAIHGKSTQIIVTPIGGQGFIFGRGNQQISAEVIRQVGLDNIVVVATESKLRSLQGSLKVDTGSSDLDSAFRARKLRVVADYKTEYLLSVE